MNPVRHDVLVDRPVQEVFDYLADVAHWPEFTDHFLVDWHLTREDSFGPGAGARYRSDRGRIDRFGFSDLTLAELAPRRRIVARGRGGKFNRIRSVIVFELEPDSGGTRVSLSVETLPALPTDRLMEAATRTRPYTRRRWGKAMKRLRSILEDGEERGATATISGGARKPATGSPIRY